MTLTLNTDHINNICGLSSHLINCIVMNVFIYQTTGSINNLINKINKEKNENNDVVMYYKYTVFQAL